MRADLVVAKLSFSECQAFSVKDPITSRFYQLREEEFFILQSLDGKTTLAELQQAFERQFAPLQLGERQLRFYIASLERQSLILGDVPGIATRLRHRRAVASQAQWLNQIAGFLAIRFRGIDPSRFLQSTYWCVAWLFNVRVLSLAVLLMVSAITLLFVQSDTLLTRLPEFSAFFSAENLLWLALALGVVKILHELGHAYACYHFGGECHELGFMLLVLTPCLYCDVSDAWLMPNKWHRIAISAAGIFVELCLAAMCTFLWWFTEPGLLNTLFLNIMIVCSVNTLLFNGNPLLRFDGYFILADVAEVPNLRQTASQALNSWLAEVCLGAKSTISRLLPRRRRFLICYAIAAAVYRVVVIFGIIWMLHSLFGSFGFLPVAQVMGAVLLSVVGITLMRQLNGLKNRVRTDPAVSKVRLFFCVAFLVALVAAGFVLPYSHRVIAPCLAEVRNAETVFVRQSGRISETARLPQPGDRVRKDEVLLQLTNVDLQRRVVETTGQIAVLVSRLESLELRRATDVSLVAQVPVTQETLADKRLQLSELQQQLSHLQLLAPVDGVVISAEQPARTDDIDIEASKIGLLDARRIGDTLPSGTTFCRIGDPTNMDVMLMVDQADIELVEVDQTVEVWLDATADRVISGKVSQISESDVGDIHRNVIAAGWLPTLPSSSQTNQAASVVYQVRVTLDSDGANDGIPWNSTGRAAVQTAPQTLASRVRRFVSGTLRFSADFSQQ